jgi:tetratricopeptide (TPR) repeat protein
MAFITLVVAQLPAQDIAWLKDLPPHCRVVVHDHRGVETGDVLDALPEGSQRIVLPGSSGGLMGSFLAHVLDPAVDPGEQHTVFCDGDAPRHAPALLQLLEDPQRWADVQPLSVGPVPAALVERDARDWIGALPVRPERYSLSTLAPLGWHDPVAEALASHYRNSHGLGAGMSVMAHFLALAGLDTLARAAAQSDLGLLAHGPVFAVRGPRLSALRAQPGDALQRLQLLCRADPQLRQLAERAVLHLCGLPMVRLDALARPFEALTPSHLGMARVVASIDAVLERAENPRVEILPAQTPDAAASTASTAMAELAEFAELATAEDVALVDPASERREAVRALVREALVDGRTQDALALLLQATQADPSEVDLLGDAATLCFHRGDLAQALPLARRALLREPGHAQSQFALAMSLAALGERIEAMALFDDLMHADSARAFRGAHPDLTVVAAQQSHHLHQLDLQRRANASPAAVALYD